MIEGYRRVEISAMLMEHGVPGAVLEDNHPNKLSLALSGLRHLLNNGQVSDLQALLERVLASGVHAGELWTRLDRALIADGFVVQGGKLAEADRGQAETQDALEILIQRHTEFQRDVLLHHLAESEKLYVSGHSDASIGQCRNLCEQLLADIAGNVAKGRGDSPDLSRPVGVRNYLQSVSFLDQTERTKLVDGVYGYLSDAGSHPGISDQTSARVGRLIILGLAFYLIEKYEAWFSPKT